MIAGFRFPICSVRESRPKLTILQGAERFGACGTGTNATRVANSCGYKLKLQTEEAIKAADSELRAQGFRRVPSLGSGTVYRREFDNGKVSVIFSKSYVNQPANIHISMNLYKLMWYGIPVPSWF